MKGMIFTTFLEMVESKFSLSLADDIIVAADLPSGGSYTTVGTYGHQEIIALVVQLSDRTGIPVADLVQTFGHYLFSYLVEKHPYFMEENVNVFDFLQRVDSYIHVEVRKLYPGAELPSFEFDASVPGQLIMIYRSARPFADLAEGLILGCIEHYGERIELRRDNLTDGTSARFVLTKAG
ncbi:heme NO-binding domain-containing protein [Paenibacillus sp. LHD-117]|uniref:heme NO-binding domain-containing protein n=1 Tax=Paenibacillus sp. LHD-117 TaxID=3071412 RepID=UPI0027E14C84|nr:heme NO-binding domain-containing protein [Paenibacillus sp. LHD-117]MDQ6423112.1 heme NO-binding domain-containing protein [Paenibacillus sp. LHD-117]